MRHLALDDRLLHPAVRPADAGRARSAALRPDEQQVRTAPPQADTNYAKRRIAATTAPPVATIQRTVRVSLAAMAAMTSATRASEYDVVARSVDGRRLLIGEAKATSRRLAAAAPRFPADARTLPGAAGLEVVPALFAPLGTVAPATEGAVPVVDARTVFGVLR